MTDKKILWLFIIVLLIIIIVFFVAQFSEFLKFRQSNKLQEFFSNLEAQTPTLNKDNPRIGNEKARVIIFEFSDFRCSYCAEMEGVIDDILKEYSENILFVWKDYPLLDGSWGAAKAGRCANEQNNFWPYHDLLFQNQDKLDDQYYLQTATALNLDINKFQNCLNNPEIDRLIEDDVNEGFFLKADATPYFFINNFRVSGYINYAEFKGIIEQALSNN
jgi:protein-disulfide isomerase